MRSSVGSWGQRGRVKEFRLVGSSSRGLGSNNA